MGTPEQQLEVFYNFLSKRKGSYPLAQAIKRCVRGVGHSGATDLIHNIKGIIDKAFERKMSNDSRTLLRTLWVCLAPSETPDKNRLNVIVKLLGMGGKRK